MDAYFRNGLNKAVGEASRVGFVNSQLHDDTAIDGTTLRFLKGATSQDDGGLTRREDLVDAMDGHKVVGLYVLFLLFFVNW